MQFHSTLFLTLFAVILAVYWHVPHAAKNLLLLAASYYFYAYWDYRFCALLIASSTLNFGAGILLTSAKARKGERSSAAQAIMIATVCLNLLPLALFKYPTFITDLVNALLNVFGIDA